MPTVLNMYIIDIVSISDPEGSCRYYCCIHSTSVST